MDESLNISASKISKDLPPFCFYEGQVVTINAEIEKAEEILEDSAEGQRLRFLENEIHKTNLKLMEGETIKKKYWTILDMLKKERLTFGNQVEKVTRKMRKRVRVL